jgi:hypothetical protein
MSVKISGKVWDMDLPPNEKYVLLALADHADHNGNNAYPGIALLARKTGYDPRNVRRILQSLEEKRIISRTHRGHGKNNPDCYSIHTEKEDNLSIPEAQQSGQSVHNKADNLSTIGKNKVDKLRTTKRTNQTNKADKSSNPPTPPYKEEPSLTVMEPSERETPAPAVDTAKEQLKIHSRYYPEFLGTLTIYQQELLATMADLRDCESAIRYSAGNGIRATSISRIVAEVYANREWEANRNGSNARSQRNSGTDRAENKSAPGGFKAPKPVVASEQAEVLEVSGSGMDDFGARRETMSLPSAKDYAKGVVSSPAPDIRRAEVIPIATSRRYSPEAERRYRFG